MTVTGPFNAGAGRGDAEPASACSFVSRRRAQARPRPTRAGRRAHESRRAPRGSSARSRGARTGATSTDADLAGPMALLRAGPREGGLRARHRAGAAGDAGQPEVRVPRRARPAGPRRRQRRIAISDIELASRLSFFLWSSIPDDELLDVAAQRPAARARRARAAGAAHARRSARRRAGRATSPGSGCTSATCAARRRTRTSSRTSTTTCGRRSSASSSCSSAASSARIAASSTC